MYDYDATGSDEISFKAGDKIKVLNRIPNGVDDGWWKGMVKSSGKVGLFPSIICEPLEESDSDEKTEDSLESPLSSCAPPSMAPPRTPDPSSSAAGKVEIMDSFFFIGFHGLHFCVSAPNMPPPPLPPAPKPTLTKNDTLDALDSMEIVVTAPTPLVIIILRISSIHIPIIIMQCNPISFL